MIGNEVFRKCASLSAILLAALVLLRGKESCCSVIKGRDKCTAIKESVESIQALHEALGKVSAMLYQLYKEGNPKKAAIEALTKKIDYVKNLLALKSQQLFNQLSDLAEEVDVASGTQWVEARQYVRKWIPSLEEWADLRVTDLIEAEKQLSAAVPEKLDTYSAILEQQQTTLDTLAELPPGPDKDAQLLSLAELIAQASAISLHEELKLVLAMAQVCDQMTPMPAVAGSVIEKTTLTIEEGLPEGLGHLDNGVLEAGSEVIIQLPESWELTAPAEISSENLDLDVRRNEPGSGIIKIYVLAEATPGKPDDTITVVSNGMFVGGKTGLVSGTITVIPGRTMREEVCVLPMQEVTAIAKTHNILSLSWDHFGTRRYTVQCTDDVDGGTWVSGVGDWPTNETSWTGEDITGLDRRYYRVISQ